MRRPVEHASQLLIPNMLRLGFGCGDLFSGAAHAQSVRLIETALDSGIRYFDVARFYGDGSAEAVLGSVLPRMRDQVIIASKAGIVPVSMQVGRKVKSKLAKLARKFGPVARAVVPAPPPAALIFGAFSRRELQRSVHYSLRKLKTDYLDILLLHECSVTDAHRPEIFGFLDLLRAQGKIRTFGIATQFAETCQILQQAPRVARVAQFASDALNRHVAKIPGAGPELAVTHTPIKEILPRLLQYLVSTPQAASQFLQATGLAAADRSGIATLLVADALAKNATGVVLFSTSRSERIGQVASARFPAEAFTALHQLVQHL